MMPRIALLPFVLLPAWMGWAYLIGAPARTAAPSFALARQLAPHAAGGGLGVWGILFLIGAAAISYSVGAGRADAACVAVFIGGAVYTWWSVLFLVSAFREPAASLTGWAIHGFIAYTYYLAAWRIKTGGMS